MCDGLCVCCSRFSQVGSTERDFEGFEGTVSVERIVSEVPARARAVRPERQQCGDYWKRNIWRSEVIV